MIWKARRPVTFHAFANPIPSTTGDQPPTKMIGYNPDPPIPPGGVFATQPRFFTAMPSPTGDSGPSIYATGQPPPTPPGRVITSGSYVFATPPGDIQPSRIKAVEAEIDRMSGRVITSRSYCGSDPAVRIPTIAHEAERDCMPGRVVSSHAPLFHPYAPQPQVAQVVRQAQPVPPGGVVQLAGVEVGADARPTPAAIAREADRPGQTGRVQILGYAPPEVPAPYPQRQAVRRNEPWHVEPVQPRSTGSRPPADPLAPFTFPKVISSEDNRQPGRAITTRTWGPPEPRPPRSLPTVQSPALVPAGGVIAGGMYAVAEPVGRFVPPATMAAEDRRIWFSRPIAPICVAAVNDARTPRPDPIFESMGPATFRSRKGYMG